MERYFIILNDGTDEIFNLQPWIGKRRPKLKNKAYMEVPSERIMDAICGISWKMGNQTGEELELLRAIKDKLNDKG